MDPLMVIQQLTIFQLWWRSTFNGVQLLVELSFWWSSSSHSFGFAQWWRFLFSYYCCCAHLSAVVERCLWHRLVHTATQPNRLSTDLLATSPRVRSPLTTILVCLLLLLSSEKKKSQLSSDWLWTRVWSTQWRSSRQEGAMSSAQEEEGA